MIGIVLLVGTVMTKPPVLQRQFATPPVDETKALDALCNTARSEKRRLGELLDDKFDTLTRLHAPGTSIVPRNLSEMYCRGRPFRQPIYLLQL